MNYGFIGTGNMGGAIIKGMTIGTKSFDGKNIFACALHKSTADQLSEECGINSCNNASEVIKNSEVLILAVKPAVLAEAVAPVKAEIKERNPLIISVAAGKTLSYLQGLLGDDLAIVRVMPNINAKVGCSTSGFCTTENVSDEQKEIVRSLFKTIGSITEIPEKLFGIHGVLGGAAPAFAYLYMDALARAAVKAGMPKKQALELTAQTVLGSAKMILESGEHPWELIDQVCSPGGTTIEGICALEANEFETALCKAFDAVYEKDKKM